MSVEIEGRVFVALKDAGKDLIEIMMLDPNEERWLEMEIANPMGMTRPPSMLYAPWLKEHCSSGE